jgi:hypothetical protein
MTTGYKQRAILFGIKPFGGPDSRRGDPKARPTRTCYEGQLEQT